MWYICQQKGYEVMPYSKISLMDINSLLKSNANVQIVVSALDLRSAFMQWMEEAIPKDTPKEEKYLKTKEAAGMLGVDISTLWRWEKTGYLKKNKIGRKCLYKESDVKKLMEG